MEINKCTSAISAYNKISTFEGTRKEQTVPAASVRNVDTVEISANAKNYTIESKKADIRKSVNADASAEKIAKLKDMINSGSYAVTAENVAAAIFEG